MAVEESYRNEIVEHTFNPEGIAVAQIDYYCDPECFAAAVEEGAVAEPVEVAADGGTKSVDEPTLFDRATNVAKTHSQELGADDGGVSTISFSGPVGLHAIIGKGADLEYQAQYAVLAELQQELGRELGSLYAEYPDDVEREIHGALERIGLDRLTAEILAERSVETLEDWQDYHGEWDLEGDRDV